MTDRFYKKFKEYDSEKPKKVTEISGLLGVPINGAQQVEVPNRNGFVYVRLRNNTSELIQAFNEKVSPVYGLPVLVVYKGNRYEVIGRDNARYSDWGSFSSFLPRHGSQHSLNFEDGQGGDVTWIYSRQMMPFATIPSGTDGADTVFVMPHVYRDPSDASWDYIGNESSPSFLPAKPTGSSARMMLLYWDLDVSNPLIVTGSFFAENLTGTSSILPYVPTVTNSRHIPLAAIRLVSGTESIIWDNIYDMRQWATTAPPPFEGGVAGQDEGAFVGTGTTFNFVGAGVTASVSGSVIQVNIPGASAGVDTIGIAAMDDGVPIGTGTTVNFQSNLTAVRSGSVIFVDAAASQGGGGGGNPAIKDEGQFIVTGSILNFTGDLVTVTASGTTATISIGEGVGKRVINRKSQIENRIGSGSNVPFIDDDFTLPISTGQVWAVNGLLLCHSNNTTADLTLSFTNPNQIFWGGQGSITAGDVGFVGVGAAAATPPFPAGTGSSPSTFVTFGSKNGGRFGVPIKGVLTTHDLTGNFNMYWGSVNLSSGVTMFENSYLVWERLL